MCTAGFRHDTGARGGYAGGYQCHAVTARRLMNAEPMQFPDDSFDSVRLEPPRPKDMPFERTWGIMLLAAVLMSANGGTDAAPPRIGEKDPGPPAPTRGRGKGGPGARAREAGVWVFTRDPLAFWLSRRAAGPADAGRVAGI